METKTASRTDISDRFAEMLQRLLRSHPKLVIPDERLSAMQKQLKGLRGANLRIPEDRMFLFRILLALRESESPPTMGELSGELGIPLSSATRMADGLVRARLVERQPDAKDRRVVRLCINENGRRFLEEGRSLMKQRIGQLLRHFTADEQKQLLRLLGKLFDSLQSEGS